MKHCVIGAADGGALRGFILIARKGGREVEILVPVEGSGSHLDKLIDEGKV